MKNYIVPATSVSGDSGTGRGGPSEVIRIRRVIEYTGTRHWIEETLRKSVTAKTGIHRCAFGTIKEVALLEFRLRDEDVPSNGGGTGRGGRRVKKQNQG